jgi:signal transduction histidine kinase/sensor domain CHASE-containing protein
MSLRRKTLLIVGLTLVGLLIISTLISSTILLEGFAELEAQQARQNVERVRKALDAEIATLRTTTEDYAEWDDTYAYIQQPNDDYIRLNYFDSNLVDIRVNLVMLINNADQVVFAKAVDLAAKQEQPVPDGLYDPLTPGSLLLEHADTESSHTGLLMLPDGPLLIASQPILTSEDQGPIQGALIMGRFLDTAAIAQLADLTDVPITAQRLDQPSLPEDFQAARAMLTLDQPIAIQTLGEERVAGYTLITDIYDRPALLLRIDLPRDIYARGQTSSTYLILASLLIGLIFAAVLTLVLERLVLARLARLSSGVLKVRRSADLSQRVSEEGRDELGQLGNAINQMLSVLERAQGNMLKSEAQLLQQNEYLAALHQTTLDLITRLDLNGLLQALLARAGQLLNAPHGFIYLLEPQQDALELKVGMGIFISNIGDRLARGEGMSGKIWQSGEPMVVQDYDKWPGRDARFDRNLISHLVGVPLTQGKQVAGVIGMAYNPGSRQKLGREQVELLNRFAQLASIALDNARLFEELQRARKEAEAANEAKSAFLASVSHELRTPLTSVLGFAKIIQKRLNERIFPSLPDDAQTQRAAAQLRDNFHIIVTEGERLTALINDLLDLAKIEAGKVEWRMEPLAVDEIIDRALAATAALFEQKGLRAVKHIDAALPPVLGDRNRLMQVMLNLLSNATKFTHTGTVTCEALQIDREIVVRVIDTGAGIDIDDQTKVFEKFRQAGDTLTAKPQGTGLGLPISREIIEHHGGRIWLESEGHGKGSTFSFTLPLAYNVMKYDEHIG